MVRLIIKYRLLSESYVITISDSKMFVSSMETTVSRIDSACKESSSWTKNALQMS